METSDLITSLDEAKRFIRDCFEAVETCRAHAETVAENLVVADYRGHFSHGMNRIDYYIKDIQSKIVDPNAVPTIDKETVATALVNGHNGLGAVVGKFCMELAIKKAKEAGIGMVTAYHSNHYGIAGIYSLQAMEAGLIGISTTNTSPVMVPTRAKKAALGTDPISFGIPHGNGDDMVIDMATTTVALGKLEVHTRTKKPIPSGWVSDDQGKPVTDPDEAIKLHKLMPLGGAEITAGYKGYGLGLMVETLSGILSGSSYGPFIPTWNKGQEEKVSNLGHAFIAIDPSAFAPGYEERMSNLFGYLRNMEPINPENPVLIPGDPEKAHMKLVDEQGGICYIKNQHDTNQVMAKKLKVDPMKSSKH